MLLLSAVVDAVNYTVVDDVVVPIVVVIVVAAAAVVLVIAVLVSVIFLRWQMSSVLEVTWITFVIVYVLTMVVVVAAAVAIVSMLLLLLQNCFAHTDQEMSKALTNQMQKVGRHKHQKKVKNKYLTDYISQTFEEERKKERKKKLGFDFSSAQTGQPGIVCACASTF